MIVFDLTILFIRVIMMMRVRFSDLKLSQQEMAMANPRATASEVLIVKAKCGHKVKVWVPIVDYLFRSAKKGRPMVSRRESEIRIAEAITCSTGTRVSPDGVKRRGCPDPDFPSDVGLRELGRILDKHLR